MAFSYKSSISFALVYIPIKLHTVIKENNVSFNMLDKKTKSRIKYIKTCEDCNGREVVQSDIVKGYKYDNENYVILENSDFEKIKTQKDKSITIDSFIDISEVDSIYYEDSYYVEPTGAQKAYQLLLEAMKLQGKAGIAKSVLGSKEAVILLRPKDDVLIVSTLHFQEEVKPKPFTLESQSANKKELEMAVSIIKSMSDKFSPENFKDEYTERLKKAIDAKIAGKQIEEEKDLKSPKISDLMTALQESVKLMMSEISPSKKRTAGKAKTTKAKITQSNESAEDTTKQKSTIKKVTPEKRKRA